MGARLAAPAPRGHDDGMHARRSRVLAAFAALLASLLGSPSLAVISNVDQASDVCPVDADPCVITQTVNIVDGSILDFGLRRIRIDPGGMLDSGAGNATVLCGGLTAGVGVDVAINARGPNGQGSTDGGSFLLQALRVCTGDPLRSCTEERECQAGPCAAGSCSGDPQRLCAIDADCSLGLCTIGSGDVDVDGRVRFDGRKAGTFAVRAAGDIVVRQAVDGSASGTTFDGGMLELASGHTQVNVVGPVQLHGGGQAQGGVLSISAPDSVTVQAGVDVSGGDFDGGFVGVSAGGNLTWSGDLLADADAGGGNGGEVSLQAGGDLTVGAYTVSANGSQSRTDNFGGDGGFIEFTAGHDLILTGATVSADAAIPNGSGDTIRLAAANDITASGSLSSRARGAAGGGGTIDGAAGGALSVAAGTVLDVRGGSAGGGAVLLDAVGALSFDGAVSAVASSGGTGDMVLLASSAQLVLGGQISMGGTTSAENTDGGIELRGCSLDLLSGASVANTGALGVNKLRAPNGIKVRSGAQVIAAKPSGRNRFEIAPTSPEPVISGIVDPAAAVVVDTTLLRCAECGNGSVEAGETCDDDNLISGDGCSSDCQDERCIAQSVDWPTAPLCNDDVTCTKDVCDTDAGQCVHTQACEDRFACTVDWCAADGNCVHEADNALCDDPNPCTADICLESSGCVRFAQDGECDDARDCTTADTCVAGRCRGTNACGDGSYCSLEGTCVEGSTTTTTTVTTTTTSTVTSTTLLSTCGNGAVETGEQCDDGDLLWEMGQSCTSDCRLLQCGDADDTGNTKASDSLFALRAAVKAETCAPCLCDVDASGAISASDALALLRVAVGLLAPMQCPAC